MNKKKVLIIVGLVLGVIMLSLLSAYLWKKYQTSKNSAEVIAVSEKYTENYGTYDSQNNVSEYLASLKPYLVDDSYSQIAQGFNNPNADKEVREYEKSIKYKIKTTALNSKVTDLSKDNKNAQVTLNVWVQTTATDKSGDSYTDNRTLNLAKQNGKWLVILNETN